MEIARSFGWALLNAIPSIFINPFLYLFCILLWMHYRRQTLFERKLFSVRINNHWTQMFDSLLSGLLPGLLLSVIAFSGGLIIEPITMVMVGAVAFLLACFHIQYLCAAYAGGMIALLSWAAKHWSQAIDLNLPVIGWVWSKLAAVNIPSLLIMIALLHLAEAYLIRKNAGVGSTPVLLSGRRGLSYGAYQLQKFWFVPFFALTPSTNYGLTAFMPEWWPYFSGGSLTGVTFSLLPIFIGNTDLAIAQVPQAKAKQSAKLLVVFSLLLLGLAIGSFYETSLGIVAAGFAILGHDLLIRFANWREQSRSPLFVQLSRGVRVLAVIPGTPAHRLGIEIGEIIVKVNGIDVSRSEEIYPALQANPAFCKIEVLNAAGNSKYLQCSIYQGDHHQLGLILSPDELTEMYVEMKAVSLVRLIRSAGR
ncbi:MAG TPA: PDZ domain-containing protein [Bacillota bacterium]|nr:PDZ domain-containing protein [Bacillota bacterium]